MKNVDVKELIKVMDELEKERGISKDYLVAALEEALVKAYKQNFDADENAENVKVTIDKVTGEMHVYSAREVVAEFPVPELEISLEDAQKIDKTYTVGDIVNIEIRPKDFGRIAAQKAKQVVVQKIREVEKEMIHAGLECGIIKANVSGLDCISCGPNMKNLHSPEEALHFESFGKYAYAICTLIAEAE